MKILNIKKFYIIFTLFLFFLTFNSKINFASNIHNYPLSNEEKIYIENDFFKVIFAYENKNDNIFNTFKIINKSDNKILDGIWDTAILLDNENLLLGEYNGKDYSYYELNKNGEKNFLINSEFYIKNINEKTGNYIAVLKKNNKFLLSILDKEFKVILKPIFEYKKDAFKDDLDILKSVNNKYGLYYISGDEIIPAIFDNLRFNDNSKSSLTAIYNDKVYILEKYKNQYINITKLKNVDVWAINNILDCIKNSLVSHKLQLEIKNYITREEFCELIVKLYENKTKLEIDISNLKNPFFDTSNEYVLKAYKLDLISGVSKNRFNPTSFLKREEAGIIISNLLKSMGFSKDYTLVNYDDNYNISSWAFNSVMLVSSKNIMQGNNNLFKPQDFLTVQEALIIISRILNF